MPSARVPVIGVATAAGSWLWAASTSGGSTALVKLGLLSPRWVPHLITLPGSLHVGITVRSALALLALLVVVYVSLWPITLIHRSEEDSADYVNDGGGRTPSQWDGFGAGRGGMGMDPFGGMGGVDPFGGMGGVDPFGGPPPPDVSHLSP